MRPQRMIVVAVMLCVAASGCNLTAQIARNLVFETCLCTDEFKGKVYYYKLACSAWKTYQGEHPDCPTAPAFGKGFKCGYADYLENGGNGSSHALPPQRFWKVHYETPEGRAETTAWLDGFVAGAAAAKASGFRELVIVPVGGKGFPPHPGGPNLGAPILSTLVPPLGNGASGSIAPGEPPPEELPEPRSVPDGASPTPKNEK